jgi:hypothetical protein
MTSSKENNSGKVSRKIHNPKSHAPAVYIPCWLIQVPQKELSHFAKILYGRLAQWSNTKGHVSRSAPQLSAEMGCQTRVIKRGLKELRDVRLIETYQCLKGGVNSFIFLDHEFMHRPLKDCLDYYEQHAPTIRNSSSVENTPVDNSGLPSDKNVTTPTTKMSPPSDKNVPLKYKEIKEIEKDKSFCASAQKKTKSDWREENAKVHDFAEAKNNIAASKVQMDREAANIAENEVHKRSPMPQELRDKIKSIKY